MRRRTLVALALFVLVLGYLQLRRQEEHASGAVDPLQHPLLVGLAPERVRSVRVDHLTRAVQVKLERDAAGSWFLTDPIAYPAVDSLVRTLLATLMRSTGDFDALVDPAAASMNCRNWLFVTGYTSMKNGWSIIFSSFSSP